MISSQGSCKRAVLGAALARRRREGIPGRLLSVGNAASVDAECRAACDAWELII